MINEAEEWINETCQTAWGTLFLQLTDELHDIHVDHTESSIHLNYGDVIDFTTGDKLEIWDGSDWVDWIATYTEGRNDDFFVDYVMGKIYLMKRFHRLERLNAKVTYRVRANSTIPRTIKYSCAYLVGINILNSEYASVSFPSGEGEELTKRDVMNRWWQLILRKLRPYTKSGLITGTPFEPVR